MNKKTIIIIAIVAVLLIGAGGALLALKQDKQGVNDKTNTNKYSKNEEVSRDTEISTQEFAFIYDLKNISEEWWNSENKEWGFTNRKLYNLRWGASLGNSSGKLKVRPIGFTEKIRVGLEGASYSNKENYILSVKENNFLIPLQLKVINDSVSNVSSEMDFYVFANDFCFYKVSLSVDDNPRDIQMNENSWKTVCEGKESVVICDSYFPINVDYCLHLSYEFPKEANKITMNELAEKVCSLITLEKTNDTEYNRAFYQTLTVKHDNIALDENTNVLLKDMRIISWHSGARDIAGSVNENITIISAYNASNEQVYIAEYNESKDLQEYMNYWDIALKEYNYKGRQIYICYYTDEAEDTFKGKYDGIFLKVDGIMYQIDTPWQTDPTGLDIDKWIETMCDGIVEFK